MRWSSGDYQIAPIAARSTAMGRWRLTPPGVWGRRLRARDGAFRAPARVTFFFCKKKVTKENHSNLRFKDPLARGRQVQIWRCVLAELVRWVTLSVQGTACTSCAAAADNSEGRGWCAGRVAIIKSRQSRPEGGFGWWRLTPPGVWGRRLRAGRGVLRRCAATPHPSRLRRATCLAAGRSVRGSDRPPACHSIPRTPQGEGFFRPGALLLALFISFWQCRSGPSGTGATGRRRGLRRGRRSWENPWHRRP